METSICPPQSGSQTSTILPLCIVATVNLPRAENPRFFPGLGAVGSLSRTYVECGKVRGHSETRVSERVTCREKEIPASFCYGHYVMSITEESFVPVQQEHKFVLH